MRRPTILPFRIGASNDEACEGHCSDDENASISPSTVSLLSRSSTYRRRILLLTTIFFLIFVSLINIHNIENYFTSSVLPHESSSTLKKTRSTDGLVLWSSDFHISPVADIKTIVDKLGSQVIDKSLSGHCHITNTCATDIEVITPLNGMDLLPCPNNLRRTFYERYATSLTHIDSYLCLHATSMCELYMPFNKPLIAIASTRYEIGRYSDAGRWIEWTENLRRIALKRGNVVAANNM
jgi:hypothetical protein